MKFEEAFGRGQKPVSNETVEVSTAVVARASRSSYSSAFDRVTFP